MARTGSSEPGGKPGKPPGRLKRKIIALNNFVDLAAPGLDHVEFRVWMILFRHAWNGFVTRSYSQLARDMGVSGKTVQRAIQSLIGKKLVTVARKGGLAVGATQYRLGIRQLERRAKAAGTRNASSTGAESVDTHVHLSWTPVSTITEHQRRHGGLTAADAAGE